MQILTKIFNKITGVLIDVIPAYLDVILWLDHRIHNSISSCAKTWILGSGPEDDTRELEDDTRELEDDTGELEDDKNRRVNGLPRRFRLLAMTLMTLLFLIPTPAFALEAKTVAITEIVEHPSLAEAKRGIIDVLSENGYKAGENLEIIDKNAQGAIANALLIAKQFVVSQPDAIVPISTQSAQSAVKAVQGTEIPVVFSSVTDPVAAGLVESFEKPAKNITGAMDYPLIDEELELIKELLPNAKTIGFLYSSGESNSVKTIELMKKAGEGKFEFIDSQLANSNQIGQAISSLVGRVDAIYIPSDNTVFSAMPKLVQMSRKHKIPVFSSDPDSVKQGVMACIGYTQYEVGRTAGKLLLRILVGERNIPVERPAKAQIFINKHTAEIMEVKTPQAALGIKTDIVGE